MPIIWNNCSHKKQKGEEETLRILMFDATVQKFTRIFYNRITVHNL